jgi:hypothetical protein
MKQGFQGDYKYTIDFEGDDLKLSGAEIRFNFVDGYEKNRQSILCIHTNSSNEVIIPFKSETALNGNYLGEFVIKKRSDVYIYPKKWYINIKIEKCI